MINADLRRAIKDAVDRGATVEKCGCGHLKLTPPDPLSPVVFLPSTPARHNRSIENAVAKIRRAMGDSKRRVE